jgi:hypothetical protein
MLVDCLCLSFNCVLKFLESGMVCSHCCCHHRVCALGVITMNGCWCVSSEK